MNDHSEHWYLERFKSLYPAFPDGTIVKTESPDFIIETIHGTIGLELTELADAKQGEHSAARLLAFRRMMVQHVIAQLRTQLPWQFAIDIDLVELLEIPKNKRAEWVKEVAGFCLDEFSDLSPGESWRVEHVDFDIFSDEYAPVQQENSARWLPKSPGWCSINFAITLRRRHLGFEWGGRRCTGSDTRYSFARTGTQAPQAAQLPSMYTALACDC